MARKFCLSKSRSSKSRPAKMGRKWTQDDMLTYKIKVVYQDLQTFFGITDLPAPNVENDDALTAQDVTTATKHWTAVMLNQLRRVDQTEPADRRATTIDFVRELFTLIRYWGIAPMRLVRMRQPLLFLGSQGRPPQVDICIVDDTHAVFLAVKMDSHLRGSDPEPRLISEAIAAFHNNNNLRAKFFGTDPLTSKVMPGIVMDGSMPTFYKIPVTSELVTAVEAGEQPELETTVHAYRPEVPRPEESIRPLDNRYIILSCFEAFRKFM